MLVFFLLYADDIYKIYDSDDNVPMTQMLLQRTIGLITEDKDTDDDEDNERYEDCVVLADDLDDE